MEEGADYVIVGAGVFGISTAIHLAARQPSKKILLVDRERPNPGAASSDYNKIIRADYPDLLYTSIALEAIEEWKNNPVYQPYFKQCGILFAEEIGMGRASLENYRALGHDSGAEVMTLEAARARFPAFSAADWTGAAEAYFNPESGWGETTGALSSAMIAAEEAGVLFVKADVVRLDLADDRSCRGVQVRNDDGSSRAIAAKEQTILCVGAHTARFLADTDPTWDELQVNGRMVAAGAVQCAATYDPGEESKFEGTPCHFLGMWHTHGESIPPLNGRLKFNCEVSFTNIEHHEGLGKPISVPPSDVSKTTFSQDVPEGLKQEVGNVVKNVFGDHIKGLQIESYRMCWDAVSPNQDWIIDHHPHCKNLLVTGAGSFHAWKFLPNIGKYVTQRLLGELAQEKAAKWAWDRPDDGAACEMYIPSRDLKTIGPFKGWPKTGV